MHYLKDQEIYVQATITERENVYILLVHLNIMLYILWKIKLDGSLVHVYTNRRSLRRPKVGFNSGTLREFVNKIGISNITILNIKNTLPTKLAAMK